MIDWQMISAIAATISILMPCFVKTISALSKITAILTQLESDVKELREHDKEYEKRISKIEGRMQK